MRILHCVATFDPASGGPACLVPQLAMALAEQGVEVGLWSPRPVAFDLLMKHGLLTPHTAAAMKNMVGCAGNHVCQAHGPKEKSRQSRVI
ncbi:MAG: hypothetical protein NTW21_36535 [Verrucomicrobia bacterium]|nr:hypothetical protein [Verrucomicrobiota bacterium]